MDEENQSKGPDLANARHAAKALLKSAKVTEAPITINQILSAVKETFDVTISGLDDAAFSGKGDAMTQRRGDYIFIIYNKSKSEVRKRFSVAHEIGHLYRGHLHGNSSIDLNSENFDEMEANTFAAHLLMPPDMFRKDVKAGVKPEELAKKYNVSLDAVWVQLRTTSLFKLY